MTPALPDLPFSTPAWLTPRRIILAAVAVLAVAAALPAVWWIADARREIGDHRGAMAAMAASTMLLSLLLVGRALRAATLGRAAAWCLCGGVAAGILNAGLSLAAVTLVRTGNPGGAMAGMVMGVLFGGLYGAPLGLIFGAAYLVLTGSALRARVQPSHDGADRVLLAAGGSLAIAGVALRLLAPESPAVLPPEALAALGATTAAFALARGAARQRWIARVAAGRAPGWQIAARCEDAEEAALLPMLRGEEALLDGVLVRVSLPSDPYRRAPVAIPAALVPLPGLDPESRTA